MKDEKEWRCICISGTLMVADFQNTHCTESKEVSYTPAEITHAGQVLADWGKIYSKVTVESIDGDDIYIRIGADCRKVTPRMRICQKYPLNYAWTETEVYVVPAVEPNTQQREREKTPEEIVESSQSTEAEKREAVIECLKKITELDDSVLYTLANLCYEPVHHMLDLEAAKKFYLEMCRRPDCYPADHGVFYTRAARISYIQLRIEEADRYVEEALKADPTSCSPLIWKANYQWHMHRDCDFVDAYYDDKLPLLKKLVDERQWQAMEYVLDMLLPLRDEGVRPLAELCEESLKQTFSKSGENNFNAIAVVALYQFLEYIDEKEFFYTWYYRKLQYGAFRGYARAMYYYALIHEMISDLKCGNEKPKERDEHYEKAKYYFRKGALNKVCKQCMQGYVNMQRRRQPDDPELPYMERVLRVFTFADEDLVLYGDEGYAPPQDEDDYPDDDGRYDAYV